VGLEFCLAKFVLFFRGMCGKQGGKSQVLSLDIKICESF